LLKSVATPYGTRERLALSFTAIELDNLIIGGLRQYTKSSLLRARTASGIRISATVSPGNAEEAAAYVYSVLNPKGYAKIKNPSAIHEKDEIKFRDPKNIEKVLSSCSASNLPNVQIGIALNGGAFSELKLFRHFFAHRCIDTYAEVQKFSTSICIIDRLVPADLMMRGRPGDGVRLMDGWIADVRNFFDMAV
jgi:hypothetical protein